MDRSFLRSIYEVLQRNSAMVMTKADIFKRPSINETLANIRPPKAKKLITVKPHTTSEGVPVKGYTQLKDVSMEQAPVQKETAQTDIPDSWHKFNPDGKGVTVKGNMDTWTIPDSGFILDATESGTWEDKPVAKWTMDPDNGDIVLSSERRGNVHAKIWIDAHGGRGVSEADQQRFENVVRGFYGKSESGEPIIITRTHSLDKEKSFNEQYKALERLQASGHFPKNARTIFDARDAQIRDALNIGPMELL